MGTLLPSPVSAYRHVGFAGFPHDENAVNHGLARRAGRVLTGHEKEDSSDPPSSEII